MKLIPLSRGKAYAIVDDEDFEYLNQWKWKLTTGRASRNKHLGYKPGTEWRENKRLDKTLLMHRVIMGEPEGKDVDHINGNMLDNRRSNLRVCSHRQNRQNTKRPVSNKSGYKGVYLDRRYGTYYSTIAINGKSKRLGFFATKEEAARIWDKWAKKLYGEYANLNFKEVN